MLTSIASRTSAGYRGTSTAAAGMPIITKSRRKFSGTSSNWIVIWLTALVTCSLSGSVAGRCTSDSLVLYRAELTTLWSRDAFPKHYPEWRPPAQWTKFIGRSHDDTFSLFRIGETASEGMQSFAESGRSELLDEHAQGKDGILDSFAGPAISQGAGKSNAEFFADANHTLVSFASRIVPSPDWIIGMDSLNLCADGRWADVMSVELDPMDVGTDKGFTFTSPNWPQEPRQPISVLGPKSPDHPASSFYYAGITELPKIASLKLIKVQEYKLLDSSPTPAALRNHQSPESELDVVSVRVKDNDVVYESVKTVSVHLPVHGKTSTSRHQLIDADKGGMNPILVTKDDPESGSILGLSSGDHPDRKKPAVDVANNKIDDDDYESNYVEDGFGTLSTDSNSSNSVDYLSGVNTDSKTALDLLELYAKKKRLNMKRKLRHRSRHCVVSEWTSWRPCSKTCGIGETVRTRSVIRHAKPGGRPCPALEERKWCGSQRDCNYKYFNWNSKKLI